jgi:AcrR family transcriptional regulator
VTSEARPLRKDAERNRQRIVEAAQAVFAERGLEATLDDIADRAGVGVGTVYRRYPNKDVLIDELFEELFEEIVAAAEAALADRDPWLGLVAFLERLSALQAANLGFKQILLGSRHGRERLEHDRARLEPLVAQLVARAQAGGRLRPDIEIGDIKLVQLMLGAVIDATHELRPDLWRRALVLVLDGLRTGRNAPSELPSEPFA